MEDTILRKYHGNRTWRADVTTSLQKIKICEQETGDWQVACFNLPYCYLRSGASSFCDFKQDPKSQGFQNMFLLFLKLLERTSTTGNSSLYDNIATFMETVKTAAGKSIGLRIWVFSERQKSTLSGNLHALLQENAAAVEKLQKKNPKVQVKLVAHQGYLKCCNFDDWVVFAANYGNNEFSMNSSGTIRTDFYNRQYPLNPVNVFGMESRAFTTFGSDVADPIQIDLENYYEGGMYSFPDESLILRVPPSKLTVENLFLKKKYLPSYFFEKVRLPAVKVTQTNEDDGVFYDVKVPDHAHRMKKVDDVVLIEELERFNQSGTDEYFKFDYDSFQILRPMIEKVFVIDNKDTNSQPVPFDPTNQGNSRFLQYAPRYLAKGNLDEQWFTDILYDMKKDPETRTLLADKYTLDELDMMKYRTELFRSYEQIDRVAFQKKVMKEFCEKIVQDVNSNVSEPMQCMLLWYSNKYKPGHFIERKKNDPNGSVFLNSMMWKLNFFDEDLQVSTGHPTLMMLNHAKYDTYRQELDLHFNAIFTGEGATSKSFLFEKMKQLSIPGTIFERTYETKRAAAIDGDRNDVVVVFNEAPQGMFLGKHNKNTDGEQEAQFKERLTSMTTRCYTWAKDEETDERTNRTTISQAIGTHFGATNDDPADCNEAMQTRFHFGKFEKTELKNKSIGECMIGEKSWREVGAEQLERATHFFQLEHFQMMLLFKMMFVGIIRYPTLEVSDWIYQQISKSLRGQKVETTTRFKERYDIMCKILTMVNALDTLYNYEGGKYYNQPFDPETLIDVEPLLYCTEEIAIFAFTLISTEIYDPSEVKILRGIWRLWMNAGGKDYEKIVSPTDGTMSTSFNYIKVGKIGSKLIQLIQQNIPNVEGRPSEFNIKACLKKFKNKSYTTYPMCHASDLNMADRKYNDGKPERIVGQNRGKQLDGMREENESYFNIQLFHDIRLNRDVDPIMVAVDNCRHHYTRAKKILLGCPKRRNGVINYPSVFDAKLVRPKNNQQLKRRNPLYKTRVSALIRNVEENGGLLPEERISGMILGTDFDNWGCLEHAKKLGVPEAEKVEFYCAYNHELVEENFVSVEQDRAVNYPEDIIRAYEQRSNEYVDANEGFNFDELNATTRAKRMRIE